MYHRPGNWVRYAEYMTQSPYVERFFKIRCRATGKLLCYPPQILCFMEGYRVVLRVVLLGQGRLSSGCYLFQYEFVFLFSESKLYDSIPVLARDIIVVHTSN